MQWLLLLKKFKPSHNWILLCFFFKNGYIFLKCTVCTDFFSKNCTDCTDLLKKLYGLYGFFLKMYGFLYGFFQKSFGHPVYNKTRHLYLYINLACLSVCLFVSNKRQNGWTDRAHIFCGTSRDPRKGFWIIKISKICV